nr:hypothetical protein [Butyrivibrio sp.]
AFLDTIINSIEPQAVEVLLEGFPAFRYAADSGQLGREIGLYVYYEKGDEDGLTAHQSTVEGGMAYVQKNVSVKDGEYFVGYIIGIDLSEFTRKDKYDLPVMDPSTGKFVLSREYTQLENTIVHEMLHAFMDDYNRVGMFGAKSPQEFLDESPEGLELYKKTTFPTWFKEGIASAVEFVYNDRNSSFSVFRYSYDLDEKKDDKGFYLENGRIENLYTKELLLKNYQHTEFRYKRSDAADAEYETSEYYYDLERSGKDSENRDVPATYVSGYLAVLYLGEMASVYSKDGSSIQYDETGKVVNVDSAKIRSGMNTILEDLHKGETLDQIINRISGGTYTSTDDFEKKFIKGTSEKKELEGFVYDEYMGDSGSLDFCVKYLNFMRETELANNGESPNGSVLLPFNSLEKSVIDSNKSATTDFYQIVQSNDYVASTVPLWNDGGKSVSGSGVQSIASQNAAPAAISPERISTAAKISGDEHGEAEKNSKSAEANPENTDEETEASLSIDGETRGNGVAEVDRSSESDDKDSSLNPEGTDPDESVEETKGPEADIAEKPLTAVDGADTENYVTAENGKTSEDESEAAGNHERTLPAGEGAETESAAPAESGKTSEDEPEAAGNHERTLPAGEGAETESAAPAESGKTSEDEPEAAGNRERTLPAGEGAAAENSAPAGDSSPAESTKEAVSADEEGHSSDKSAEGTDSSDNGENVQGNESADAGRTPGTTGTDQAENAEENNPSGGEEQSPGPASPDNTPEPAGHDVNGSEKEPATSGTDE